MNKKTFTFFIISIITIIFLYSLINIDFSEKTNSNSNVFSIKFEYFGMDAKKIEEIITTPLEKKLFELDSIKEIKSTCKYNQSLTTIWFMKDIDIDNTYLQIQKTTEELYKTLPQDVQNPEIYFSNLNDKPTFCISLIGDKNHIEKIIKPQFESIPEITQVNILGGNTNEIQIEVYNHKLNQQNLTLNNIHTTVLNHNSPNIQIEKKSNNFINPIFFNNKLNSIDELKESTILFNEKTIPLNAISKINLEPKENNELILINNNETVVINIKTKSNANLIKISNQCNKIINSKEMKNFFPIVIYDKGEIVKKELISAISIMIFIIFFVSIFVLFFYQSFSFCKVVIIEILTTLLWTLGSMAILKIPLCINTISGISIAIGLIVDTPLVIFEIFKKSKTSFIFKNKLSITIPSIICSSITTTIVLIPLLYTGSFIPEIVSIILPILLMIIYSTIFTIFVIPTFLNQNSFNISSLSKTKTIFIQKSINIISKSQLKPKTVLSIYLIFSITVFVLIFTMNKKIEFENEKNVVYCSIEFNPEREIKTIKKDINLFLNELNNTKLINFIQTEISRGKAELSIFFNNSNKTKLINFIHSKRNTISNGTLFLYNEDENLESIPITFAITGENEKYCRTQIKELIKELNANDFNKKIVLNFKEDEKSFIFIPDNYFISKNNFTVKHLTNQIRTNIFGSIITKTILANKEIDIRLKSNIINDFNILDSMIIPTDNSSTPLSSFGKLVAENKPTSIYRLNNRPCAYFTIYLKSNNLKKELKFIKSIYSKINNQEGYNLQLPSSIKENDLKYFKLIFITIFCLFLLYITLTIQTQNLITSSKILFSIFPNLFLPIFFRFILRKPLDMGDFIGITLLCGTVINNMIYIIESKEKNIIHKIKSKFESIFIQTFTTLMSSFPMIILAQNSFSKSLCFCILWGTLSSLFVSFIFFPSLTKTELRNTFRIFS